MKLTAGSGKPTFSHEPLQHQESMKLYINENDIVAIVSSVIDGKVKCEICGLNCILSRLIPEAGSVSLFTGY